MESYAATSRAATLLWALPATTGGTTHWTSTGVSPLIGVQYRRSLPAGSSGSKERGMSVKNKWLWGFSGLLLLAAATWSQAQQASGGSEKAVAALENQWLQADKTNNPDLAAPLMADKYISTAADGTIEDKAQTLADARARKYTSAEYEDLKVTIFGDTAIATGAFKGKGTDSGKPFDEHLRWTDTWVRMPSGKWQCVATH